MIRFAIVFALMACARMVPCHEQGEAGGQPAFSMVEMREAMTRNSHYELLRVLAGLALSNLGRSSLDEDSATPNGPVDDIVPDGVLLSLPAVLVLSRQNRYYPFFRMRCAGVFEARMEHLARRRDITPLDMMDYINASIILSYTRMAHQGADKDMMYVRHASLESHIIAHQVLLRSFEQRPSIDEIPRSSDARFYHMLLRQAVRIRVAMSKELQGVDVLRYRPMLQELVEEVRPFVLAVDGDRLRSTVFEMDVWGDPAAVEFASVRSRFSAMMETHEDAMDHCPMWRYGMYMHTAMMPYYFSDFDRGLHALLNRRIALYDHAAITRSSIAHQYIDLLNVGIRDKANPLSCALSRVLDVLAMSVVTQYVVRD